jgi:hypothetical protein
MNWSVINWKALERLRAGFLAGTAGATDYWQSESDLISYDATFAQRIGWKWDYVLAELQRRGWSPAAGALLDWGCGSGIAHRAFLDHFGTNGIEELRLWDRSTLAMRFAERRAKEKYAGLKVAAGILPAVEPGFQPGGRDVEGDECLKPANDVVHSSDSPGGKMPPSRSGKIPDTTLLISHVLTELEPEQVETLTEFAAGFTSVIWVEPGTFEASLTLIAVRERLRGKMNVVAPCTHQTQCGMLAPGNENHWCHHFAAPPPEVFTDSNWAKFGELAGVDLRSLPVSFLVLDKRPITPMPPAAVRLIGRPRIFKPHALVIGCDESGVGEKRLTKRHSPAAFREWKRGECDPLQIWRCEEDEIMESRPL